ncbi:MBL fold metallo-hydrolase [Brevibacillus choshinensis]|uniref:MBL fold metallo-hydrolase n=1 Tax=Brevibacillus choshinensis TaxID=54911 RepID=A0ABX7FKC4_BRECH|nr:MBL fold metallo-hydrolase [Brevibacillus choshinensis]QRG66080.1 MBL fold metallo-hydrolase [Brevibacillus choshinensis]
MKAEQISEHVWSLSTWLVIPLRVWVVVEPDGVTLVDAGIPFLTKGILSFIDQLGAGPLKQIVLTHGHSDHVGAVKRIVEARKTPVFAHEIEIPYLEGKEPYPRRKKAEMTVTPGVVQPLRKTAEGELETTAGLTPYHTPGHSPGHVVYYHEADGVLLAGDLFTSKAGKLNRPMPMFTADMAEALKSSLILRELQPAHLEVCHGKPVKRPAEHLDEYLQTTARAHAIPESVWQ